MRKIILLFSVMFPLFVSTSFGISYDLYQVFSIKNLPNQKPSTIENYAESLINKDLIFVDKIEILDDNEIYGIIIDPFFEWTHAVVKWGNYNTLFEDDGDSFLSIDSSSFYDIPKDYAISHIDFFKSISVPEISIIHMLILGIIILLYSKFKLIRI